MPQLSPDQLTCLTHVLEWYDKDSKQMQYVTVGGFAGTGKTTLIAVVRRELYKRNEKLRVAFVSYTGKAARVLASRLHEEKVVLKSDTVSTIHSLIYSPVVNEREEIVGWNKKEKIDADLIIIDEASMVDAQIWSHLLAYGKPIIVVGDHGQLPPIAGAFHLMQKPDLVLSQIHRQEEDNPIIHMSILARTTGHIPPKRYGKKAVKFDAADPDAGQFMQELLDNYKKDTLILCGYNKTRNRLNAHIRASLGFDLPSPQSGDRVICLRNNHRARINNGQIGTIESIDRVNDIWYEARIRLDGMDVPYAGKIAVGQFGADQAMQYTPQRKETVMVDLFDFGYAITVHKAQGSQAKRVIVFEERFPKMDDDQWKRWLYTAVTRAEEELYIFSRN